MTSDSYDMISTDGLMLVFFQMFASLPLTLAALSVLSALRLKLINRAIKANI